MKKKLIWSISYGALLLGFTLFIVLDTFVISHGYKKVNPTTPENLNITINGSNQAHSPGDSDAINISFEYSEYRKYNTNIYVLDLYISDITALQTAFADDTYGQNIKDTTSNVAKAHNAIFAVNGDYYGIRERGFVLRNGELFRRVADKDNRECCVIYKDGNMEIYNEADVVIDEIVENGAWQIFSFGPGLLKDNEITVGESDEVQLALASNPRTAIGCFDNNHYIFVVSDGRTKESEGLSLYKLAEFMKELGVKTAYNLDGGGSSTLYFDGKVLNKPTADGYEFKERSITDIIYISGAN